MPKIKASSIEELKSRVNIYDVVSAYVSLKKSGSSYKGRSPFTTEKTPSFFVHPDKNYFFYHDSDCLLGSCYLFLDYNRGDYVFTSMLPYICFSLPFISSVSKNDGGVITL